MHPRMLQPMLSHQLCGLMGVMKNQRLLNHSLTHWAMEGLVQCDNDYNLSLLFPSPREMDATGETSSGLFQDRDVKLPGMSEEDVEELKAFIETGNLSEAAQKAQEALELSKNTELNIAITGESGSGKSSFVNAMLGLADDDEGAAEVGITEMTTEPTAYLHPMLSNVKMWDLPGIGTPTFRPDSYLQQVSFARYDFFIIVTSKRFRSCNADLAQEIQKMGKKFYFVRSKVDEDLRNESRKRNYNQETTLQTIRDDCVEKLRREGVNSPQVFLISRWEFNQYDSPQLQETLASELDSHKRHIFLLALPNISRPILVMKKEALKRQIWKRALKSCAIAAVPIPHLSVSCDVDILVESMTEYCKVFGLDEESLIKLSTQVRKPVSQLKDVIKTPLAKEISREDALELLSKVTARLHLLQRTRCVQMGAGIQNWNSAQTTTFFSGSGTTLAQQIPVGTASFREAVKVATDLLASVFTPHSWTQKELFKGSIKVFEEFTDLFKNKGQAEVASIAQAELESFKSTILNIAVTGETGAGKSSFINALQGLTAEGDGAAPTGVTETMTEPTVYPYPNHPNVRLWDLPGTGTPDFQPNTYLKQVNFKCYDFFVIIASECFKGIHMALAREIERMGKRFYFVRSKVDEDLCNEERDHPRTFSQESVLERLRMDCRKHLQKAGISNPEIFLLSSCEFTKYDAPGLVKTLQDDIQGLQRLAFLLSLPNLSAEIIEEKKAALKKWIWLISLASAFVNVIPIPGISVACDISILLGSMIAFYKYFGLDDGSLANLARQTGKPIAELKAVIISPEAKEINRDVVIKLLLKTSLPKLTAYVPVMNFYVIRLNISIKLFIMRFNCSTKSFITGRYYLYIFLSHRTFCLDSLVCSIPFVYWGFVPFSLGPQTHCIFGAVILQSLVSYILFPTDNKKLSIMSTEDFKAAVKAGNLARAISIAQEIMNRRFAVAVIGKAGSGASSFVNAIRDLKNDDTGAAQIAWVGNRTNRSPTSYRHPRYPKLYFWDMPEISRSDFKADKYLEQVGFDPYDLFIIIASERFINIHTELAKEIQRRGKSFYFVRSKVDNDVLAEMAEESALQTIREECKERLQIGGLTDHQVFLISSSRPCCYDFPLLKETLFNKIVSQEREKLLSISRSTLQEKKAEKWVATIGTSFLTGGFAVAALLGPFDYADSFIMTNFIKDYYKDFGLDDDSLSTLAGQVGKDLVTPIKSTELDLPWDH
uniref:IRG-type G domain-containing protein n=1 Tax=Terrapene triunguis TaxID=2587831 RepID=A0A674I6L7_9SAUR